MADVDGQAVLIDSSAWVEAPRADGDACYRARVDFRMSERRAATCEVVAAELLRGACTDEEYHRIQSALRSLPALDMTGVGYVAGAISRRLRGAGITIPTTDLLIAATAVAHDVALLHRDKHLALAGEALGIRQVEPA